MGYILLGLVAGNETGMRGILIYILVYTFMNLGAFAVLVLLRRKDIIGDEIEDLSGLYFTNPGAALMMLIFLLSLAGIPPTAGFLGKYFIFLALIETGHYVLAVFAVLYVAVALYYYFRLVVMMFMHEAPDVERPSISAGVGVALAVTPGDDSGDRHLSRAVRVDGERVGAVVAPLTRSAGKPTLGTERLEAGRPIPGNRHHVSGLDGSRVADRLWSGPPVRNPFSLLGVHVGGHRQRLRATGATHG